MNEISKPRRRRGSSGEPTVADVARLAQVSTMTVSRVVNGKANVVQETRERVEKAIAELGYVPNAAARSLAGRRQCRIALLHSNPSAAYLSDFLVGSLAGATEEDAQLVVEAWTADDTPQAVIGRLVVHRIDAVLLPPPLSDDRALIAALRDAGLPFAQIATGQPDEHAVAVSIDDAEAAQAMTSYLIEKGHTRIGFIGGDPNQTASALRRDGYEAALTQAGIAVDPALIAGGDFSYRSGLDAAEQLLAHASRPTAIFASNDDMAAAVLAAAHRHRLDVPRDLSVTGFDDSAMASTVWPELTTVRQPVADMAKLATVQLARNFEIGSTPCHIDLPFELILRASAGAAH